MNKKIILIFIFGLFLITIPYIFADVNWIEPGSCLNLTIYNESDNKTYNETYCSYNATRNINKTLQANETWQNTSANMTVFCNWTESDCSVCFVNVTLDPGETYTKVEGSCNVTVFANESPECPECNVTANFTKTFEPKLNESITWYMKNGSCMANITVLGYPICTVSIPEGSELINSEDAKALRESASKCEADIEKSVEYGKTIAQQDEKIQELETIGEKACPMDESVIFKNWKSLPPAYQKDLEIFLNLSIPVTVAQFAEHIRVTEEQDYWTLYTQATYELQRFEKTGFANRSVMMQFSEKQQAEMPIEYYSPLIPSGCIKKMGEIKEVHELSISIGRWQIGKIGLFLLGLLIVALIIVGLWAYPHPIA